MDPGQFASIAGGRFDSFYLLMIPDYDRYLVYDRFFYLTRREITKQEDGAV
jgi:hypothetical protein